MKRNDQSVYEDHAATWWDSPKRFQRLLANQVYERMDYFDRVNSTWEGLETLDLGCGGGYMAEMLARRGARVVGVDPCTRGLEAGRRHARESGLNIRYLAGIGQSIPLEDDSVDRVVCVDVLEHVRDFPSVLSEIRRVLRPGGTLFFDCVNRNWFARLVVVTMAEVILRVLPLGTHDPDLFIRPDELTAHLESLGFRVSPIAGMRPVRLNRRIDFVFGLLPPRAVTYIGHAVLT